MRFSLSADILLLLLFRGWGTVQFEPYSLIIDVLMLIVQNFKNIKMLLYCIRFSGWMAFGQQ